MPDGRTKKSLLPAQASSQSPAEPPSFGGLARRVAGWTSNLIATGIVAAVALGLGRQLVSWWGVEPESLVAPAFLQVKSPEADPAGARRLEFGELPYSVGRETFAGPREAAMQALVEACRRHAATEQPSDAEPTPAERRILSSAEQLQPIARDDSGRSFYSIDGVWPLLIATALNTSQRSAAQEPGPANRSSQLGAPARRVVACGMMAPAAGGSWTLYTFGLRHADTIPPTQGQIPLPPQGRRTLALHESAERSVIAFTAQASIQQASDFYMHWFEQHGWTPLEAGRFSVAGWSCRYQRPGDEPVRAAVQLASDRAGGCSGLLTIEHNETKDKRP